MNKHPANHGKALLSAWVDPALRDYAREAARQSGYTFSRFVELAVMRAVQADSLARLDAEALRAAPPHDGTKPVV